MDDGLLSKDYITSVGLSPGGNYGFRVQIRNQVGFSSASEIYIIAAGKPDVPTAPSTSISGGTSVQVLWTAPFDGASVITSYKIYIRHADEISYSLELSSCDGSE